MSNSLSQQLIETIDTNLKAGLATLQTTATELQSTLLDNETEYTFITPEELRTIQELFPVVIYAIRIVSEKGLKKNKQFDFTSREHIEAIDNIIYTLESIPIILLSHKVLDNDIITIYDTINDCLLYEYTHDYDLGHHMDPCHREGIYSHGELSDAETKKTIKEYENRIDKYITKAKTHPEAVLSVADLLNPLIKLERKLFTNTRLRPLLTTEEAELLTKLENRETILKYLPEVPYPFVREEGKLAVRFALLADPAKNIQQALENQIEKYENIATSIKHDVITLIKSAQVYLAPATTHRAPATN